MIEIAKELFKSSRDLTFEESEAIKAYYHKRYSKPLHVTYTIDYNCCQPHCYCKQNTAGWLMCCRCYLPSILMRVGIWK